MPVDKLIVPAILVKTPEEFLKRVALVKPHLERVQVDVMDGKFVPNETLRPELIPYDALDGLHVEYHLMVNDPMDYVKRVAGQIGKTKKNGSQTVTYQLHVESFKSDEEIWDAIGRVRELGSGVFLAVSPDTPVSKVAPFLEKIDGVLVMTVYPGFSGQSYIRAMEKKMSELRKLAPQLEIEVDGGIGKDTIGRAANAGANLFGVSSAIFAAHSVPEAIKELKNEIEGR